MQIKYPSWLPKFIGSTQTPQEMNQVIDVIQNHAENLSRHYRLILTNVGGIYPDIILPNSPFPEGITQAVFLVGPGTYVNFGNVVVPNNNVGLIFYYDETFDLSLVPLETYDDTPLRNRVTALEDKNGGEIAEGNNKNVTGGQVHSAMQSMETGGAKNLLDLEDVDATQIPDGNFLVGKAGQKTEFRKLHAKDVRIGAGYQSGEYVVSWNYGTNNWGSGTLVTTSSIENSIAKRDARGRLIAEAGTGEKHLVNYGQLPFKLFETENEALSYLSGGLAKYGQLIFLQSGPQKGRMLQVNETLDGYNTLFDYELNLSSLLDLNDFPNAYTDAAGKVLIVNPTSSGVQFKSINEIDGIATYDSNGNLTATEATTNENVPTLGQVLRLFEEIEPSEGSGEENVIEEIKIAGTTISPDGKSINIPKAGLSQLGVIKPDGLSITVDSEGTARAIFDGLSTMATGNYQTAVNLALANNHLFGYMLVDTIGGIPIRKVIFHTGDGVFVDAIGAVVEYELDPEPPVGEDFRFTIQLTDVNQEVYIPVMPGFTYNMTVDWGDGSPIETYNKAGVYKELKHTYLGMNGATFQIKIEGVCPNLRFDLGTTNNLNNLKSIDNNTLPSLTNLQLTNNTNLISVCANAWFNVTSPLNFLNCTNITTIEHGFYQYTQGKGITEVSFSLTKLTDLENEFFTYINLSTANSLFRGTYLTYIPSSLKAALVNVTNMYYMFQGINNDVTIPNDLFDLIPNGVLTDCRNAFAGASGTSLSKVKGDAKVIYDKLVLKSASGVQTANCFSNNQMTNRNQVPTAWGGTLTAE